MKVLFTTRYLNHDRIVEVIVRVTRLFKTFLKFSL